MKILPQLIPQFSMSVVEKTSSGSAGAPAKTSKPGTTGHLTGGRHSMISHAHLKFDTVVTTLTFEDGTTAEWTASEDTTATGLDNAKYRLVIRKTTAGSVTYSMLSLGLQSVRHRIKISNVTGGMVQYAFPPADTALKPMPVGGVTIPIAATNPGHLNIDHIGFLAFDAGICEMDVVAIGRAVVGNTYWKAKGPKPPEDGHDNNPPVDPPA